MTILYKVHNNLYVNLIQQMSLFLHLLSEADHGSCGRIRFPVADT